MHSDWLYSAVTHGWSLVRCLSILVRNARADLKMTTDDLIANYGKQWRADIESEPPAAHLAATMTTTAQPEETLDEVRMVFLLITTGTQSYSDRGPKRRIAPYLTLTTLAQPMFTRLRLHHTPLTSYL